MQLKSFNKNEMRPYMKDTSFWKRVERATGKAPDDPAHRKVLEGLLKSEAKE